MLSRRFMPSLIDIPEENGYGYGHGYAPGRGSFYASVKPRNLYGIPAPDESELYARGWIASNKVTITTDISNRALKF